MNKILEKVTLNPTVKMMRIEDDLIHINSLPGQFVIIRVDDSGERIPLTIYDKDETSISVIYQIIGKSTHKLDQLEAGDFIKDVVGPLGRPTDLSNITKVAVIGGGVGCAIAFPIAKKLYQSGVDVTSIIGFRTKDLVILENEFKAVSNAFSLMTDDGTYGEKGTVVDSLRKFLENSTFDKVIAIGPIPMMKYVSLLTKEYNIKTEVSLNSIMIDGTGMCGGCRVTVNGESKFACVDGPDFDGHAVDFDGLMRRNAAYLEYEKAAHQDYCRLLEVIGNE